VERSPLVLWNKVGAYWPLDIANSLQL